MSSLNSIVFIKEEPQYSADFDPFTPSKKRVHQRPSLKILNITVKALEYIKLFFSSLATSIYHTILNSGDSFNKIVLGTDARDNFINERDIILPGRLRINFVVGVMRGSKWLFSLVDSVFMSTLRIFYKQININSVPIHYLNNVIEEEINVAHFRTNEIVLDVNHIPEEIKIDSLSSIFQDINFDDEQHLTYMDPSCLDIDEHVYDKEYFSIFLQKFIDDVKKRTPSAGTPPSYDPLRLKVFYQKIENAIRLSLFYLHEKIVKYKQIHGDNPDSYEKEIRDGYKDLLRARSHIAIDIARIACKGNDYMQVVMKIYHDLHDNELIIKQSLEESLIEILANKRKEIALAEIQKYWEGSNHQYEIYMWNLGKILGIPGAENIIKDPFDISFNFQFSNDFDVQHYLSLFVKKYNVNMIIQTISEKLNSCPIFHDKVQKWLKEQNNEFQSENELIEWMLVSHNILLPQKVKGEMEIKIEEGNSIVENPYQEFISTILNELDRYLVRSPNEKEILLKKLQEEEAIQEGEAISDMEALIAFSYALQKERNPSDLEELANRILQQCPSLSHRNIRYRFEKLSGTEEILTEIFNLCYSKNSNLLITAAKKIDKNNQNYYPLWKKNLWIHSTEFLSVIFKNFLVRIIAAVAIIFLTFRLSSVLVHSIFSLNERDLLENSLLAKIRFGFLLACAFQSLNFGKQTMCLFKRIGRFFHRISTDAINERIGMNKPFVYSVWQEATRSYQG